MAQSRKPGLDRGKKPASPKRGNLRVVEELKPVHVLSLRLPRELFDRLTDVAKKERRSFNNQIAVVVEEWLDGKEAEARRSPEAIAFQESANNEEDGEP